VGTLVGVLVGAIVGMLVFVAGGRVGRGVEVGGGRCVAEGLVVGAIVAVALGT
jgi:hypothetical protein